MKKYFLFSSLFLLIFTFSSCATMESQKVDKMMRSWLGESKDQLQLKWGPPSSVLPDGKGGEIYSYESTKQTPGYEYYNLFGERMYKPPDQYKVVRQFFINSSGNIYDYRWHGLDQADNDSH